ncbi:MAG TPA: AMP-binding protein [Noviherbaspirillum sp.]|nr:AMP-binding protein [Noviherbaspirillum sp.]
MDLSTGSADLARVNALLGQYGDPAANVAYLLCDRHDPNSVAYRIVDSNLAVDVMTYGQLRQESEIFANALRSLGVAQGDRVATLMGKSRDYLVTLLGIWRVGAVHVPLFTAFASPEIATRLKGSRAKVVVADGVHVEKLTTLSADPGIRLAVVVAGEESYSAENEVGECYRFGDLMAKNVSGADAATVGGDAPLIQIYTSGTTGKPKGVVVPVRAIAGFHGYGEFGLGLRPTDIYWCAADPGWAYGLYFGIICSLATGVSSVLLKGGFSAANTLNLLSLCEVTNFTAAPTVYRSLLTSGVTPPPGLKLRCASSAGEPLTPEVNQWAVKALGVEVADHYGQTEAGMLVNNHHHPDLKRPIKERSMGIGMPGWKPVVIDQYEDVLVETGQVGRVALELSESPLAWFKGYFEDPGKSAEKFAGNGRWYLTGDLGYVDSDGYIHFSSRADDVIIMAGYRISPFEVESALLTHPDVAEAAVIAAPDKVRGEVLEAYVVLKGGIAANPHLEEELKTWVKRTYAAHAYPRQVHLVQSLPKTPSGKIKRFVLRELRAAELKALAETKSAA